MVHSGNRVAPSWPQPDPGIFLSEHGYLLAVSSSRSKTTTEMTTGTLSTGLSRRPAFVSDNEDKYNSSSWLCLFNHVGVTQTKGVTLSSNLTADIDLTVPCYRRVRSFKLKEAMSKRAEHNEYSLSTRHVMLVDGTVSSVAPQCLQRLKAQERNNPWAEA